MGADPDGKKDPDVKTEVASPKAAEVKHVEVKSPVIEVKSPVVEVKSPVEVKPVIQVESPKVRLQ